MRTEGGKQPHKLPLLDGLRGVAACVVVCLHLSLPGVAHGYLAVDFFFMLSGFVVTLAYQHKLDDGWPLGEFLMVRIARLYPLYALGLLLGFLFALQQRSSTTTHLPLSHMLGTLGMGMVFLPQSIVWLHNKDLFPYDLPLWSIFFELLANVGHGLFVRRRGNVPLLTVAALATVLLFSQAIRHGDLDVGARINTFNGGLVRVAFSYLAGILVFRLWSRWPVRMRVPALVPLLVLLSILCAPHLGWWYDPLVVVTVMPCLLLASASALVPQRARAACAQCGAASYAVYVLHVPLFQAVAAVARHTHSVGTPVFVRCAGVTVVAIVAVVADRLYDAPARSWLRTVLVKQQS